MSKANLKSYHWETVNDVDFFTNGVVCTDINIKDTVKTLLYRRFWKKRQHQLTLFLCVPCKKTATKHMPVRKLFYTEYYPCTHNKHM